MAQQAHISPDHPLARELASLRAAVTRYEKEAYTSSAKRQRHVLEASFAFDKANALESENARLRQELVDLRAHPHTIPPPETFQIQELTLALRRLSDKLDMSEDALRVKTEELAIALRDVERAKHNEMSAYALAARVRAREEDGKARERELERKSKAAEEERKLTELVVDEYADLVKTMEGRRITRLSTPDPPHEHGSGNGHPHTPFSSLADGRSGLQKLLKDFNANTERLQGEIEPLHGEVEVLRAQLAAEKQTVEQTTKKMITAHQELHKLQIDDNAAARMVSRYMKFSQSSTDVLHTAIENMKIRHSSTVTTFESQIRQLELILTTERLRSDKLRDALDQLTEEISRETYGRRREVSLRLGLIAREEKIAEAIKCWFLKSHEALQKCTPEDAIAVAHKAFQDAEQLLQVLDTPPTLDGDSPGSVARVIAAQEAVSTLTDELHRETDTRLTLQRQLTLSNPLLGESTPAVKLHAEASTPLTEPLQPSPIGRPLTLPEAMALATAGMVDEQKPIDSNDLAHATSLIIVSEVLAPIPARPSLSWDLRTKHERVDTSDGHDTPDKVGKEVISAAEPLVQLQSPAEHEGLAFLRDRNTEPLVLPISNDLQSPGAHGVTGSVASRPVNSFSDTENDKQPVADAEMANGDDASLLEQPIPARGDEYERPDLIEQLPSPRGVCVGGSHDTLPLISSHRTEDDTIATSSITPGDDGRTRGALVKDALLSKLALVKTRYNVMQRAFRHCHIALEELKRRLSHLGTSDNSSSILQAVVERLDDFSEDVRSEVEIRVADEDRISKGYETLLLVPAAMSSEEHAAELEKLIDAFVDGSDGAVRQAMDLYQRKLDDLQHDIAAIKRTLHESEGTEIPPATSEPSRTPTSWSTWTTGLLPSSQTSSPAPTFGAVITAPRLRHSPSIVRMRQETHSSVQPNPLASLKLRIPMPSHFASMPPGRAAMRVRMSSVFSLGIGGGGDPHALLPAAPRVSSTSSGPAYSFLDQPVGYGNESDDDVE